MKTITIEGQLRSDFGKKATRLLRSEEQVPCVIYGGAETVNFSAPAKQFKSLVYTPDFQLAEIKLGEKSYRCVLKDLQFDVVTDELAHVDFLELVDNKEVLVSLPIKIVGQSEGVKAGGKLVVKLKTLKVRALPKDLRENLEVSIDGLELNGNIRVEDVKAPNITILNSPRIPIASVVMTRQLRQEEAADSKKK
ncbi:LSU ribosomal protein L25P [Chitinophaga costaii]|uniref:Large ribosomal subunit protein bL25 n=1 Tax=Chitinophaga costaii TaxID=1335309 RepID=A0A1C3ZYB5_9BACT|nr:50S ribosomal protein L25 [Chitinophaga costaii]PUZ30558.1 50S ribosomal protein L25 [Chitinophaga costaii]SCB87387.1 LSU ribosomal protein L25P [Chitinophaga costaii]